MLNLEYDATINFLEVEETGCSGDVGEDTAFEVKESPKKKRPRRDLDSISMPQRIKRQKCSEEGVNTSSDFEEVDEELESTDHNAETEDTVETTDSDGNTEGTCFIIRAVPTIELGVLDDVPPFTTLAKSIPQNVSEYKRGYRLGEN